MRKPEKANQMISYLEEQLLAGIYPEGSRIPSVRRLSSKFGITYSSALRGIDYLCYRGVLEKSANRGIYVKNCTEFYSGEKKINIAVLIAPYMAEMNAGLYYTALNGMQKLALRRQCTLKVIPVSRNAAEATVSLQELCGDSQGVIMLHEFDYELRPSAVNLPAVGVMMHSNLQGRISIIDIDPFNAAESAVGYFKEHGITETVVVSCFHSSSNLRSAYVNRGKIFSQYWQDEGFKVKDFIISRPSQPAKINYSKKVGYIFTSDSLLQKHSEEFLDKNGKLLASEHVVLGIDGKNLIDPEFHNFPTVSIDWSAVGKCALEECAFKINSPGTLNKRIYLNGVLKI